MNGEKLFEELRAKLGSALPRFVFMTGELVDSSAVARYNERGARVLQKPFQISGLAALLAELLQPQPSPTK
jgi:DNA-binding response OmpR family regulator